MPTSSSLETLQFSKIVKIFSYPLLSFKSFTERSASCIAFELLRILISFTTSASVTGLNVDLLDFLEKK